MGYDDGEPGGMGEPRPPFLPLPTTPRFCLLYGALLGLLACALTFPLGAIFGPADRFAFEPDQQQHLSAIRYFAWDDWRWPLFLVKPLGAPEGTNIVFTDGLPAFSLLVRLLRGILFWPDSNFLALWMVFCYALQGLAAVAALLLAGVRRVPVLLLGAVFALALPSFILRFSHTPLCTQGLILLGLGLYFRGRQPGQAAAMLEWGLLLCWLTLLINAYLYVMVSALFGALWLAALVERGLKPLRALLLLALHLGVSLAIMWAGGYLAAEGAGTGFGLYSWNPLSLVLPQESFLFPDAPMVDATGGQYEGFSYLGLGLLLALLASLVALRGRLWAPIRRHWALLLAVLALLLLALSNKIYLGPWLLLDLGEAPSFLGALRSSGRMVWVLVYLLLLAVLLTLPRRWGSAGVMLLAVLAALQVLDSQGYRDNLRQRFAEQEGPVLPAAPWSALMTGKTLVEVLPDFGCSRDEPVKTLVNTTVYRASEALAPVSTVYSARPLPRSCSQLASEGLFFRDLPPDHLLVVVGRQENLVKLALSSVGIKDAADLCRQFKFGVACSRTWPALGLVDDYFKPVQTNAAQLFPAFRLGTSFRPSLKGEMAALTGPGWGEGPQAIWTLNGSAWLVLRPDSLPARGLQFVLQAELPATGGAEAQDLWITVNGKELGRWRQEPSDKPFRAVLRFASSNATSDGLLLIGIHNEKPVARAGANGGATLGLRVEQVTLQALP